MALYSGVKLALTMSIFGKQSPSMAARKRCRSRKFASGYFEVFDREIRGRPAAAGTSQNGSETRGANQRIVVYSTAIDAGPVPIVTGLKPSAAPLPDIASSHRDWAPRLSQSGFLGQPGSPVAMAAGNVRH